MGEKKILFAFFAWKIFIYLPRVGRVQCLQKVFFFSRFCIDDHVKYPKTMKIYLILDLEFSRRRDRARGRHCAAGKAHANVIELDFIQYVHRSLYTPQRICTSLISMMHRSIYVSILIERWQTPDVSETNERDNISWFHMAHWIKLKQFGNSFWFIVIA